MNRIRLLPEQVANQIAAGEVVERPASVVKELVENALDAEADPHHRGDPGRRRSLVRVTDDGIGMSRDDALLCLERHATSKIERAEDLAAIATMGFRGEALPSIASVSRFTLTTRERDSDSPEGTQIIINGGKIVEVKAAGSAPGTAVEVRQLFFNLPARRKFLRTEETESAHIQHYLTLAALAFPRSGFHLSARRPPGLAIARRQKRRASGRPNWPRSANGCARLRAASRICWRRLCSNSPAGEPSREVATQLRLRTGRPLKPGRLRIWGFIGAPGVSRATREDQHLFVNRRPVENRGLNLRAARRLSHGADERPLPGLLLIPGDDPAAVDVNIHPAKREVKFHREAEVRRMVAQAVRETLLRFHAAGAAPETSRAEIPPARNPPAPTPGRPTRPPRLHWSSRRRRHRNSAACPISPINCALLPSREARTSAFNRRCAWDSRPRPSSTAPAAPARPRSGASNLASAAASAGQCAVRKRRCRC